MFGGSRGESGGDGEVAVALSRVKISCVDMAGTGGGNALGTDPTGGIYESPVPEDGVGVAEDGRNAEFVAHGDPGDGDGGGDAREGREGRVDVKVAEEGEEDVGAAEEGHGGENVD